MNFQYIMWKQINYLCFFVFKDMITLGVVLVGLSSSMSSKVTLYVNKRYYMFCVFRTHGRTDFANFE